ncbi:hypothetical protein A0J61_04129 [Choanephora cucurbitarum]|uniref:WAP domain-containing protein n=1 Tax=Choanephora cucurbitarum TaxID=101091 RepID=A0A1C7NGZ3_9FUNG|nr:hypothetical protein A0J61_04129 [Choanephora cucurbitarum]
MKNILLPLVLLTSVLCKVAHDNDAQNDAEHIRTVTRWEPYPVVFAATKVASAPKKTTEKGLSFVDIEDDESQSEFDEDLDDYNDATYDEYAEEEDEEDYENDYEQLEDTEYMEDEDEEIDEKKEDQDDNDDVEKSKSKMKKKLDELLTVTRTKMHVVTALAMLDIIDNNESTTDDKSCLLTVTETVTKESLPTHQLIATVTETETERFTTTKTVTKNPIFENIFPELSTPEATPDEKPMIKEIATAMLKATKQKCLANGQPCTFENPASCCSGICINEYGTGRCGSI